MIKGEHLDFSIPENVNLGSFFLDVNLELGRGDKTALYCEDRTYSFRDLWLLTNKVGNVLRKLGVEPENRVLLILEDSPEWAAAWLATMKVGGVGTHAYTYLKPHDYEYLVNLVRPKVVVVDAVTLAAVREGTRNSKYPKAFLVAGEDLPQLRQGEFSLNAMLETADCKLEVEPTHRDDTAFWNFSGGTTGKPKGVPHMHRDGVICSQAWNYGFNYGPDDVILKVPKLFFHYARDIGLLFPLRNGAGIILFRGRATPARIFELIRRHRPTMLINVPTMMRSMIQTPANERADLGCLRYCISSGEMLPTGLHEEWLRTFGTEVINRYGSAETGMGMLDNRPGVAMPGSSGRVTASVELNLVDAEGREVSRGQSGTLLARCASAGRYYVREHEKSNATFLGNGWVNTGDLFTQDENGYFWHMGRADDMVKVSGVWVSPLETEHVLQKCPRVKDCAVLGIEDQDGLTKLKAFVVLAQGAAACAAIEDELKRFCREAMAPHKIPRTIEFLDELPKTGSDKIDRRRLRELTLQRRRAALPAVS
jgi:benzoate-CoA ligase family protein